MGVKRLRSLALLGAALLSAACADSSGEQNESDRSREIAIHADSARPLDRRLFGTNVPAWLGPDKLADPAFQAATTALGTTLLRFPGGSWSNGYDWLACERDVEPDCFATWAARPSDFVGFMQATGLPGVWTTSFSGTAEEAAAAVAFFNGDVDDDRPLGVDREGRDWKTVGEWAQLRVAGGHPQPAGIELWEIGNEVYGARPAAGSDCAEFGWEDVWTCDGTEYVDGDDEHDGYLEFHEQMRIVDPEIEVGAVGLFDGESWGSWGSEVIAGTGELLDFYVIHHYGFAGEPDEGAALALPQSSWPELMQVATETLAVGNPSRTVPVAITEYNMVAFQDADDDRLMARAINLLYMADTIGQMAENGVTIANQWNLANGKAPNGTDYGMIDADTGARNPQYYALALWTRFGDELLATDVGFETDTELSAYAGRAADGTISLLAINKTGEPTTAQVRIGSGATRYTARADVVAAESLEATTVEFNGSADPSVDLTEPPAADLGEVGPEFDVTFEPYSVTLVRLTPAD